VFKYSVHTGGPQVADRPTSFIWLTTIGRTIINAGDGTMAIVPFVIVLRQGRSMLASAIRALMLMLCSSAPRRAVAMVCALAFLAVGFAHSVHDFGTPLPLFAAHADAASADNGPDSSKKAPVAFEHCHACEMIAMAAPDQPATVGRIMAEFPGWTVEEKRPHPPVVEIPPPIAQI
jgi:hypothetical protein